MNDQEKREWQSALDRNATGLRDSAIFMQLWSDGIAKDPLACMQLGLCMMMDKPIHVVVPVGSILPENMRKVAASVEYYDRENKGDIERASKKIFRNAKMIDENGKRIK